MATPVFLGIDIGTSGVRGSCINADTVEIASFQCPLPQPNTVSNSTQQSAAIWKEAAFRVISHLAEQIKPLDITALAIDGTSGTVLACDDSGKPLAPALMYNDQSSTDEAEKIANIAPTDCAAHGATSSLAKAMQLLKQHPNTQHICHQSDWVTGSLTGKYGMSDENNCLKLGYDLINRCWPGWIDKLNVPSALLPRVQTPGDLIGSVLGSVSQALGLAPQCQIISGTTDSIAAFIATGAKEAGDAVTSLGSTLVLKVISDKAIYAPELGIYSHRLGKQWLAGGASNSGGGVLLQHFTEDQLAQMTPQLQAEHNTGLNYYPLPSTGERFPRNDPNLKPQLSPRPASDVEFFQALLEGIANIEAEGYQQLAKLGAPLPKKVFSTGGGSGNAAWATIREHKLGIPVITATHTQASYGAALLAKQGYEKTLRG